MTADKHIKMGVGTRKPWEKFDINYERFEAVDEDEAEPSGGEAALSWHQTAAAAYVSVKLPAPAKMNDIEVGLEAKKLSIRANGATVALQHPSTKTHEQSNCDPEEHRQTCLANFGKQNDKKLFLPKVSSGNN